MKRIGKYILLILLILTGIWFYRRIKEKHERQKELEEKIAREREEDRKEIINYLKNRLHTVRTAISEIEHFLDTQTGYFSNYQLTNWKTQHSELHKEISDKAFDRIQLDKEDVSLINYFLGYFKNGEKLRNRFNEQFVNEELERYSAFFDHIEGRKLDNQQRNAIVKDEDNNIVIAGAGSGKTTTIVGKVKYIIERYNISPKEILLISFTNKSAENLSKRITEVGVDAKTFHKFCLDLITSVEGDNKPSIFDENQLKPFIRSVFDELLKNKDYLQTVIVFFTEFLKSEKSKFDFNKQGEYIQYLKDQNYKSYKLLEVQAKDKKTFNREIVKSVEECKIANYLLFKGIEYSYELPYEYETSDKKYSQYKPDFTITNEGKRVYIEHFGISKDGKVPTFFAKPGQTIEDATKRYWEKIEWARELHKTNGTTLIETYSYQMKEETLYSELEKALKEVGVIFNPKSPEQIWQIIIEAADNEVSDMVTLFSTFLNLMKTNNYSIDDLFNKNDKIDDPNILNRNAIFLDIVKPIIKRYSNHLNLRKEIDFADLIAKATNYVLNEAIKLNYKYIIIDEYQDISMDRYHLINAIKTKIPSCKLFCVGDDWQSIFRFGGSDIGLFRNFEKYFGVTVASRIETTYRFSDPLIKASSQFILRNPNQINKELKSFSSNNLTTYDIRYSSSVESDDTLALQQIFDELILAVYEIEKRDILLLGRYNFDFNRIKNADNTFSINKKEQFIEYDTKTSNGAKIKIKTRFLTIHKSKGLEADIVIILNCNSGKYGFPSGVSDDEVLNLVLSEADQFENGEERRLFYVAMTRAKQKVIFITNTFYKSKFISEFVAGENDKTIRKCPICLTAELRTFSGETKGKAWTKHSCSNYRYGCDYTEWEPSLPNPANKMIESIDNQKEDVVKPKISNSGKDVRSPKISQAQPKVTPILGEFISNEEKPTEQILAKEINEKELLERSNTGRKVSFSFKFIPHETEVSTDSLDGSIIYKFKLSTKYKLATHLKIYRKDMFANMKDFKTIELANYPYAYEGSSFFLDESEMPILWLRK